MTRIVMRLIGLLAVLMVACTPQPDPRLAKPAVRDRATLLALTRDPVNPLIEAASQIGYRTRQLHPLPGLNETLVIFDIPDGRTIPQAIEEIEARVPGVTAGADHLYYLAAGDLTNGDPAYANSLLDWPADGCPTDRKLGLIDAGIGRDPQGLDGARIQQQAFVDGGLGPVTHHGTAMAQLLVGPGRIRGAQLYSAAVVDPTFGTGDSADVVAILRALDWLKREGVDVVNISLTGAPNKLLRRAMGSAADDGMILVAAAGNDGPQSDPVFPAAFPFVIAATAVDRDKHIYRQAIRGDYIDFAGPGVDILTGPDTAPRLLTGTSAAAPFVTAAIAANPALRGLGVDALRAEAVRFAEDLGPEGWDPIFGNGLLLAPPECR